MKPYRHSGYTGQGVHNSPGKVIAFVKFKTLTNEGIRHFILNPRTDFHAFIEYLLNAKDRANWEINAKSFRWVAFHEKTKGSKEFTMRANPNYIISYSISRGFFKNNVR